MKTLSVLAITGLLALGCANTSILSQDKVFEQYPTISNLNSQIEDAKNKEWDLLSPTNLNKAEEIYSDSYTKASKQISGADKMAQQGIAAIELARKHVDVAEYELRDVITARNNVLQISPSSFKDNDFLDADETLRSLAKKLEEGKTAKVRADREALKNRYTALELLALKKDTVQEAALALKAAKKTNVDDYAPLTIQAAQEELALAINVIEADRSATVKSKMHAQMSIWNVNRATQISETIKEFKQSNLSDEGIVLWYQDQLESALGSSTKPDFSLKNSLMVSRVNNQLIAQKNKTVALETALSGQKIALGDKELKLSLMQKNEQQVKAKFAKVQANFNSDEAEVYRQGNNVLIRTYGFTFPSGSSEIQSSNFPLLNKIVKSIDLFDDSLIEVSGHTDNRGSDLINNQLSKDRAAKVVGFLVSVGEIPTERVSSVGFGDTKPIASNDDAAGRSKNRRVEILIKNN